MLFIIITFNFVAYFHQIQSITDLCRFSRCISSSRYKQQTQENFFLRAKSDRKSAILLQRGQFDPKFQVQVVAIHQSLLHG